jgi:serine/threonine protein kinase
MSPEVANRENYNQGADVFSFGMVLFEILSLNEPTIQHGQKTVDPVHLRICKCWPESVKDLMVQTWSPFISERPTMEEVCTVLGSKIADLEVCNAVAVTDKLMFTKRQGNLKNGQQKRFQSLFRMDDASVGTTAECSSIR